MWTVKDDDRDERVFSSNDKDGGLAGKTTPEIECRRRNGNLTWQQSMQFGYLSTRHLLTFVSLAKNFEFLRICVG